MTKDHETGAECPGALASQPPRPIMPGNQIVLRGINVSLCRDANVVVGLSLLSETAEHGRHAVMV